jgi:hypothetical protein
MAILRLLAVTVGSQLFHTIRRSDGSWLAFKDVEQGAGHFGDVNRVTAVQLHAELHVIAVPLTGRLRYAFLRVDGTWNAVAGIETQTNEVGGADSVALATIGDELHLAATFPLSSTVFRHTVRSADGHWLPFEADVRPQTGGVGVVGTIAAVRIGQEMACDEDRNRILNGASSVGSRRLKVFAVNPRRFRRAGQDCGGFEFGIGIVAFGDSFCGAVASSILAVRNRDAASVAETMRKPAAAV